jgi:hypothetical protein
MVDTTVASTSRRKRFMGVSSFTENAPTFGTIRKHLRKSKARLMPDLFGKCGVEEGKLSLTKREKVRIKKGQGVRIPAPWASPADSV